MKNYLAMPPEDLSEMVLIFACRRMDEFDRMPSGRSAYTPAELMVASRIRMFPGQTVTDLAKYFGRTKGAISQLVKKLRDKGLCEGQTDSADRKKILLKLTPLGEQLCRSRGEHVREIMQENMNELIATVGEDALNGYFAVIDTINRFDAEGNRK